MKGRMVVRALLGDEDCLQIALGPGAKQRCWRRNCETGKPSLTNPWTDRVAQGIVPFPFSWPHSAFSDSPSLLADYDLQPILPPTCSFMFFLLSAWSSCEASPGRVSLFCLCASVTPSEDGSQGPAVSLSVSTPAVPTRQWAPEGQLTIPNVSHTRTHCWVQRRWSPSRSLSHFRKWQLCLSSHSGQDPRNHSRLPSFSPKRFPGLAQTSRSSRLASTKPEVLNSGSTLETLRKFENIKNSLMFYPHTRPIKYGIGVRSKHGY